jgi:hypothetical protein
MAPFAVFTPAERTFLQALTASGVRFMRVGMGAAVLQGVDAVTEDLDLWFEDTGDAAGAQHSKGTRCCAATPHDSLSCRLFRSLSPVTRIPERNELCWR